MIIKWHKNIARFGNRRVTLDKEILKGDIFKEWVVLVTKFKMYFYGKEDYVLSIPVLNVVFSDRYIFYHSALDKSIYRLIHPLDIEEFVFYSPSFVLFDITQNLGPQFRNKPLFILERNNCYVIKHKKIHYIEIVIEEKKLFYRFIEYSLEDFMKSDSEKFATEDYVDIDTKKNEVHNKNNVNSAKISSSIDEKLNMLKFQGYYKVIKFKKFLVVVYENILVFIDVLDLKCIENSVKNCRKICVNISGQSLNKVSKASNSDGMSGCIENKNSFLCGDTFVFDFKIEILRTIDLNLGKGRTFTFLHVDNRLFYDEKIFFYIDSVKWPKAFVNCKFLLNYHQPFWTSLCKTDLEIFNSFEDHHILNLIKDKLETKKYDFSKVKLEIQNINIINEILEKEFMKSEKLINFFSRAVKYRSLGKIPVLLKCERLMNSGSYVLKSNNYDDLLNVNYIRILNYNSSLIEKVKFKKIRNLAYTIIYLEERREKLISKYLRIRKWCNYKKIFYKFFRDTRMNEVYSIFFEDIKTFELDENDVEDKKEKFYITRLSCNIGKSFAFVNCFYVNSINTIEPLKFPLLKNQEILNIEVKAKGWLNWPSFCHSCSNFLINRNDQLLTQKYIENMIKKFRKVSEEDEYLFSGMLYSFVLIGKFKDFKFDDIKGYVNEDVPLISMIILIGIGTNNKKQRLEDYEELCYSLIKQNNHPYIKIGSIIGLGYLFMNTQNSFFKELLIENINLRGVIKSEKYNKNNIWYYDKTYRIVLTFALSLCMKESNIDVFEYIKLDDKLCELILNGIILWDSDAIKHRKKLERYNFDHPEELFYSEFFILGLSKKKGDTKICDDIRNDLFDEDESKKENIKIGNQIYKVMNSGYNKNQDRNNINKIYRYAGKIFYLGVSSITKNLEISDELVHKMISLCLQVEKIMIKEKKYKILFDYILISLSLIKNSSCDLEILRIIRRQIKKIEVQKSFDSKIDFLFTSSGIKKETNSFLSYGEIEMYKICLGMLTFGLSKVKISKDTNTLYNIITTFYVNWPISAYDQEYFTLFRYNLLFSLEPCLNPKFNYFFKFHDTSTKLVSISKYFKDKMNDLDEVDKKCVIDLLSDYYENYFKRNDFIIDIEHFKDLVIRCK